MNGREVDLKVIDSGLVFQSVTNSDLQSCTCPQICVLPDSRWVCTFRAAPQKSATSGQRLLMTISTDEGRSWSEPVEPFMPPVLEGRPGAFRAGAVTVCGPEDFLAVLAWVDSSDPSLAFFNPQTEGLLDMRIFLSRSEDSIDWSKPELVDTYPFTVPAPITGPVLVLKDGVLACQFELNKHYYDTSVWHHKSVIMYSYDRGKTWPDYAITSDDPDGRIFYWDQRPNLLSDGTILDLFWTYDTKASVYLDVHACCSMDNGKTWSKMWNTAISGQPAQPISLPDGRTVMVYVDRTEGVTISAVSSADRGRSWPGQDHCVIYSLSGEIQTGEKKGMEDAWSEMAAFSVGLPATAALADGNVLVVYYAGEHQDRTDIRWARLSG